jgi:predicted amidophosphoribosyltransferase
MRLPDARDLPEQHTLSRAARLANLRGAMLVDPLRLPAVQGRQVLLVDDVMTTGASLRAAAGALVLARTPAPGTADAVRAATDADQALYRD